VIRQAPHILCVNPWIHDFAAFDFWAKPLGLLSIAAILREKGLKTSYIDCLDRFHPSESRGIKLFWDGRGPFRKTEIKLPEEIGAKGLDTVGKKYSRYGIKPEWFIKDLKKTVEPDIIFITSLMTYWASGVKETIDIIKEIYPDVPIVLGGIYATLNFEHAKKYTRADLVVQGAGEPQLKQIVKQFTGFELDDRQEIRHWHKKYKIINFAFYDDALLMNAKAHAFTLFEKIIDSKLDLWFHTPNALHVKAITKQAARLMFNAGFKTIRLGLETTEFSNKRSHDVKVFKNDFFQAIDNLKTAGFSKEQMGAYLLCGLPEQNLDEVESSMKIVADSGIVPVLAYYTPIPHTQMWENAVQHSKFDLLGHPVFTNNTLFPCVNSNSDLKRISQLKNQSN